MRPIRKPHTHLWKPVPPPGSVASLPWVNHLKSHGRTAPILPPPITDTRDRDNRDMDEHWTAVTAYLADMDFPNEG